LVDTSRAMLAAALAFGLYLAAGVILLRAALRRFRRKSPSPEVPGLAARGASAGTAARLARAVRAAVLALAGAGLLCAIYARLVEPDWPAVRQVAVPTAGLSAARPVRLVLISDTHSDPEARLEPRLPEIVAGLRPDLIVFAGDALNSPGGLPHFRELMTSLAAIAPTYAVRGNWDVWFFAGLDLYGGTGVGVLDGQAVPVRAGGSEVWLAGFGVPGRGRFDREGYLRLARRALAGVPAGRPAVFVHHYPEVAALGVEAGAGLGLAGDTHGGQIRLPLLGELVRLDRLGRHWDAGPHRLDRGWLYVNRGLGMEGGAAPRIRFLCRPEVTLIELVPEGGPSQGAPSLG